MSNAVSYLKKNIEAKLFLDYLISQGFNPNNYGNILELNQDVTGSLSLSLREYKQFLLSTKVVYSDLISANIYGAYGYLEDSGMVVPKTIDADNYFFGNYLPKVPYQRHWYAYPRINECTCEYDATISKGISEEDNMNLLLRSKMDLFLGDMIDVADENYEVKKQELLSLFSLIKDNNPGFKISRDQDTFGEKEYILLIRKR